MMVTKEDHRINLENWASSRHAVSEGRALLPWQEGIEWLLGYQMTDERGDPPFMCRSIDWAEETEDGTFIVADAGASQVIEINRDYDILWKYGSFTPGSDDSDTGLSQDIPSVQQVSNHPSDGKDKVLISDAGNGRVLLVDKSSKSVEETLTSIDSGNLSSPFARWPEVQRYNSTFYPLALVDPDNHYATEVNWSGAERGNLGTWGVAGGDADHLDTPTAIAERGRPSTIHRQFIVADSGNERTPWSNFTAGTIDRSLKVPMVQCVHNVMPGHNSCVCVSGWESTGLVELGDGAYWFRIPLGSRWATLSPNDLSILSKRHALIFRQNFRAGLQRPGMRMSSPKVFKRMDSVSLGGGASGDYYSFFPPMKQRTTVKALTTEDATLEIYTLQSKAGASGGTLKMDSVPATWNEYDSIPLTADSPEHYNPPDRVGVMAARITMGGTGGDANLWIMHGLGA